MGNMADHWFWALVTGVALLWYSTITVYVAVRAVSDIRRMLGRLKGRQQGQAG
jgi:hypothetical protein